MAEYLKGLIKQKDDIEIEIQAWFDILKSQGDVGMDAALVDAEGFPRNDIDIVQVRTARNKIICLQNDHKSLMKQIENGLVEFHSQNAGKKAAPTPIASQQTSTDAQMQPFAAIDLISRESPAEKAGLKIGDVLVQFGSVSKRNFTGMATIANVVQHSKDKTVNVTVIRDEQRVSISLVPRQWEGRGLLGCNIVPL
uniref:26S proteasome non-ATPase regulatory subunit 9 n=1 Tax=Phallusia mammillata TaxID=59560 RepID=A0A6F9DQ46_9ASCI|nr:26S proteasome non-ATPase regulatory subunit 9-like [Phallusia mammillata]CAB3265249.1 26S proteasome non-ATPase regulatory subunit 9-like [Phallusia mammillata]